MHGLGTHILLDLYGCDPARLDDVDFLREMSRQGVRLSGATIVGEHSKKFEPQGASGVVIIAESHLSFHSWPEFGYLAMDYFTCGDRIDLDAAVAHFEQQLGPHKVVKTRHARGEDVADRAWAVPEAARAKGPTQWLTEYHDEFHARDVDVLAFQYAVEEELHHRRSEFQEIRVVRNPVYGRMLVLDGYVNATEGDEWAYHEMLAHVPLCLHPRPESVLIIGGGDGGLLREVLRHPTVRRVEMVELDPEVVASCREHLPGVGTGFDDPRATLHFRDGTAFVRESDARYDAVLVDATDPEGPGEVLYQTPFYADCRRRLKDGGLFAAQALSPWLQGPEQERMFHNLHATWPHLRPYLGAVPSYPGGQWTFVVAADRPLQLEAFDRRRADDLAAGCRYYNAGLQVSAFGLPNFLRERLARPTESSLTAAAAL